MEGSDLIRKIVFDSERQEAVEQVVQGAQEVSRLGGLKNLRNLLWTQYRLHSEKWVGLYVVPYSACMVLSVCVYLNV